MGKGEVVLVLVRNIDVGTVTGIVVAVIGTRGKGFRRFPRDVKSRLGSGRRPIRLEVRKSKAVAEERCRRRREKRVIGI